jgi:hypothetical protein
MNEDDGKTVVETIVETKWEPYLDLERCPPSSYSDFRMLDTSE